MRKDTLPVMGLLALLFLAIPAIPQVEAPLKGRVVTNAGQPLPAVMVYGSRSKKCCPFKSESTTTNENGEYRLEHPGAVVHFRKPGFQPLTVVVQAGKSTTDITLEPSGSPLVMPVCEKPQSNIRRIGWGKSGLQFNVPEDGTEIVGGKPDVDYVRYGIRRKGSKSYLELWFGPDAMSMDPDDNEFINSTVFQQRNVIRPDGADAGLDNSGRSSDGTHWRQTAVEAEGGAIYKAAVSEDRDFFDRIINSLCELPYQRR
jgi:Carboxypeptidase regulatory-like domain